jgi:pimeloyl-ACP methyl ester carboxylesterase
MATFVLVHGANWSGRTWRKAVPLLRGAGYDVHAPSLTGLGERAHLISPQVGLRTHVDDIVTLLDVEDLDNVVLVGSSYGGMVVRGVVDRVPERRAHAGYVDAHVPLDGESTLADAASVVVSRQRRHQRSHSAGTPSQAAGVGGRRSGAEAVRFAHIGTRTESSSSCPCLQ